MAKEILVNIFALQKSYQTHLSVYQQLPQILPQKKKGK